MEKTPSLTILTLIGHSDKIVKRYLESLVSALSHVQKMDVKVIFGVTNVECCQLLQSYSFRNVYVLPKESLPGEARNSLLQYCDSEWILFLDDDVEFSKTFLRDIRDLLVNCSGYDVIGGANLTPPRSNSFQVLSGKVLSNKYWTGPYYQRYRDLHVYKESYGYDLTLCNLLVKSSVFSHCRFGENIWCAEENFLIKNLRNKKSKFLMAPQLNVYHWRRETQNQFNRQIFKYGFGRGQMERMNKLSWLSLFILSTLIVVSFAYVPLFLLLSLLVYFLLVLRSGLKEEVLSWEYIKCGVQMQFHYFKGVVFGFVKGPYCE